MNKQEAADHLGISIRTLQRLTSQGKIAARQERGKTGPVTVYDTEELDRYKRESEEEVTGRVRPSVAPGTPSESQALAIRQPRDLQSLLDLFDRQRAPTLSDLAHKLVLTLDEAARLSGLSRGHLRQAISEGKLKGRIIGRGFKVKRSDLDAYVRKL